MIEFKAHLVGTAKDRSTGFSMGFDITVQNGGNLDDFGKAIQGVVETLSSKAVKPVAEPSEKSEDMD